MKKKEEKIKQHLERVGDTHGMAESYYHLRIKDSITINTTGCECCERTFVIGELPLDDLLFINSKRMFYMDTKTNHPTLRGGIIADYFCNVVFILAKASNALT